MSESFFYGQRPKTTSSLLFVFIIILTAFFLGFWWLYKLDLLPGLTGDEAWFALRAMQYKKTGIDSFHGLNNYTGILQSLLDSVAFKWWGTDVQQMRIFGVVLNSVALIILGIVFIDNGQKKAFLIFLLLMTQSCLYLVYPRIAWEVNSLNLLFLALNALSITKLDKCKTRLSIQWSMLFLLTNMIGSYNHLIFSGFSIALFGGILLWSFYSGSARYSLLLPLFALNAINVCLLFVAEIVIIPLYLPNLPVSFAIIGVLLMMVIECFATRFINEKLTFRFRKIPSPIIHWLLVVLFAYFSAYHGSAFYDTLCNYKIMVNVYGFKFPLIVKLLFFGCGTATSVLLLWIGMKDLREPVKPSSVFIFVLIVYLATLPFYTRTIVLRYFHYYLIAYALSAIYLAIRMAHDTMLAKLYIPSLLLSLMMSNGAMVYIFTHPNRQAVKQVRIGNTTGSYFYFVPSKPLIDFLKKNKIGKFYYVSDENSYFLENVVEFYQKAHPWPASPQNSAEIDYDQDPDSPQFYRLNKK